MLRLHDNRLAQLVAIVFLVAAPVASAFVCGAPAQDCCSTSTIDHAREAGLSAPVVALPPATVGTVALVEQYSILALANAACPQAVPVTTPLRI